MDKSVLRQLELVSAKFSNVVLGQAVMQAHSHEYGIEPETLDRPMSLEESKKMLEFLRMALASTEWFVSPKVTNIQAFKNLGWSMHCYDAGIPFIDPNQLNKRANHLKKRYREAMQQIHEEGVSRYLDANGNWVGETDQDHTPMLRTKANKRRRLDYFVLSHKIPRWSDGFQANDPAAATLAQLGKDKTRKRRESRESERKRQAGTSEMDNTEVLQKIVELVSSATGAARRSNIPNVVNSWSANEVYRWATTAADLAPEDAEALSRSRIDGRCLLTLASGGERRIRDVPGLSYNGCLRLVDALVERPRIFFQGMEPLPALHVEGQHQPPLHHQGASAQAGAHTHDRGDGQGETQRWADEDARGQGAGQRQAGQRQPQAGQRQPQGQAGGERITQRPPSPSTQLSLLNSVGVSNGVAPLPGARDNASGER
eukprot:TRINITY_DN6526_c0_g1_i1.p1 TRINITY_DN6526_c0_g1~~TRINITY_DN6526_c0_g1_i1.p1  ORF type:complete len:484 (+),score=84.63 TRINITY_DN6526_c0_g1_i1:168-1454(+)